MTDIEFVAALREQVVDNGHQNYLNIFKKSDPNATDTTWKNALSLYNKLEVDDQVSFLQFLRLIQAGTLAHVLAILDGCSYLTENREEFFLTTTDKSNILNGNLLDTFWEMEQNSKTI
jgi:hypothetical protein